MKSIKTIFRGSPALFAAFLPLDWQDHDKVSKETKTAHDFLKYKDDKETGKDRLYLMYSMDEFGRMSPELNSIYQAGFLGFLAGALYGGFIHSRNAYETFMDKNQATAFKSHLDAKKKLQDQVTVNFAKGAFKFGWRLSAFCVFYMGITTSISVYRGKSSFIEYITAGALTGFGYKFGMGPRGMAVGFLLGGTLGGIAGGLSLLILNASGMSMEEVRYWQYKWRSQRDNDINEALKKNSDLPKDDLMDQHEKQIGTDKLSLDNLDIVTEKPKN